MLDWDKFIEIADKYQHKARREDREDLRQTIILRLAEVASNNSQKPDNLSWAYRIASFTVAQYWRDYYYRINGIDCGYCSNWQRRKCHKNLYDQCPKAIEIESLNKPIVDEDGHITELGDLLADDNAIDLDAWLDAKTWLLGCPRRLIQIAYKLNNDEPLTGYERLYLCRWRERELKKHQKTLF